LIWDNNGSPSTSHRCIPASFADRRAAVTPAYIEAQVKQELEEIERRRKAYPQGRARVLLCAENGRRP
jgi:predicted phosphoribosyltransferase